VDMVSPQECMMTSGRSNRQQYRGHIQLWGVSWDHQCVCDWASWTAWPSKSCDQCDE